MQDNWIEDSDSENLSDLIPSYYSTINEASKSTEKCSYPSNDQEKTKSNFVLKAASKMCLKASRRLKRLRNNPKTMYHELQSSKKHQKERQQNFKDISK